MNQAYISRVGGDSEYGYKISVGKNEHAVA